MFKDFSKKELEKLYVICILYESKNYEDLKRYNSFISDDIEEMEGANNIAETAKRNVVEARNILYKIENILWGEKWKK